MDVRKFTNEELKYASELYRTKARRLFLMDGPRNQKCLNAVDVFIDCQNEIGIRQDNDEWGEELCTES